MKNDCFTGKYRALILILSLGLFLVIGFGQPALADFLGDVKSFSVDPAYDSSGRMSVSATLRVVGANAYFYVGNAWWSHLTSAQQNSLAVALSGLSAEFDNIIYPRMTAVYGLEWRPGIDNDNRITILVAELVKDAGGYFKPEDEYLKSQRADSNEREMIYLNSLYLENILGKTFLAHEFQHLITFYQKTVRYGLEEDVWLNEARSEYAPTLLGYDNQYELSNLKLRVDKFLSNPSDPLGEWHDQSSDYGVANLFMQYLIDHYGTRILTLMMQNSLVGINSIDAALRVMGQTDTFAAIFTNWTLANYLNNCSVGPAKIYCYSNFSLGYDNIRVLPTAGYVLGDGSLELASWIKDWSPRWYKIDSSDSRSKTLKIDFEGYGINSDFMVSYILWDGIANKAYSMNLNADQRGGLLIPKFGSQIRSVLLVPVNTEKRSNFSNSDPNIPFSFKISASTNFPSLLPDGSLVKADNDSKVYQIDKVSKRWITDANIFITRGFKWADIKTLAASDLAIYPEGKAVGWSDGTLIKSSDAPTVYVVSMEKKRPFSSAEVFVGLGYRWGNIKTISQSDLDQYESGVQIDTLSHPDGALVKFSDSPNIYLIEGGARKLIPSIEVFLKRGYGFSSVLIVDSGFKSKYPDGDALN
ncbi:hypothetical protein HY798_01745 [Candidatus Falkowbacteria bacterium]|nr:hypothetical protein [Candidatus Falkowbacteria bacterium]